MSDRRNIFSNSLYSKYDSSNQNSMKSARSNSSIPDQNMHSDYQPIQNSPSYSITNSNKRAVNDTLGLESTINKKQRDTRDSSSLDLSDIEDDLTPSEIATRIELQQTKLELNIELQRNSLQKAIKAGRQLCKLANLLATRSRRNKTNEINHNQTSHVNISSPVVQPTLQNTMIDRTTDKSQSPPSYSKAQALISSFQSQLEGLSQTNVMETTLEPTNIVKTKSKVTHSPQPVQLSSIIQTEPFLETKRTWKICGEAKLQVLSRPKTYVGKPLGRKPRSLLMPTSTCFAYNKAFVSTFDGCIQVYDMKRRVELPNIPSDSLNNVWSEDMEWISDDTVALASQYEKLIETNNQTHQLALLCNIQTTKNDTLQYDVVHLDERPHSKGITCVAKMTSDRRTHWLTSSFDHRIILWSYEGQFNSSSNRYKQIHCKLLHEIHTSRVNAVYYNTYNQMVLSGGSDKKLIGWSIEKGCSVLNIPPIEHQIRDIHPIETYRTAVLVGCMDSAATMKLFDSRANKFVMSWQTNTGTRSPSVYQKASVHPNGMLVTVGDSDAGFINLYDLRYAKFRTEENQKIHLHKKPVLSAKFPPTASKMFMSISTDNDWKITEFE